MIKYVVKDNYGELQDFNNYEDAKKYAKEYIDEEIPYLASVLGGCGVEVVTIVKEIYELTQKGDGINLYKFIDSEELERIEI